MLATGWEHKVLSYTALEILFSLYFIPNGYEWQKDIYFFSFLTTALWAYFCFKRWKLNKKGLDKIGEEELAFEQSL